MGGRELEAVMVCALGLVKPVTEIRPASGDRARPKTGHHRGVSLRMCKSGSGGHDPFVQAARATLNERTRDDK
jgi:hypothetical protein